MNKWHACPGSYNDLLKNRGSRHGHGHGHGHGVHTTCTHTHTYRYGWMVSPGLARPTVPLPSAFLLGYGLGLSHIQIYIINMYAPRTCSRQLPGIERRPWLERRRWLVRARSPAHTAAERVRVPTALRGGRRQPSRCGLCPAAEPSAPARGYMDSPRIGTTPDGGKTVGC